MLPSWDRLARGIGYLHVTFSLHMHSIYLVYTWYILSCSNACLWDTNAFVSCNAMLCTCLSIKFLKHHFLFESLQNSKIAKTGKYMAYSMYIFGIYLVYTMKLCCVDLKVQYSGPDILFIIDNIRI